MNQVVQENAATAEEVASGAEELNAQADNLKEIISFFKTGDASPAVHSSSKNKTAKKTGSPVQSIKSKSNGHLVLNMNGGSFNDDNFESF